jgi:hypothetical protein
VKKYYIIDKMLRGIFILLFLFFICPAGFCSDGTVLSAGISINSQVPVEFMGTWRVASKLTETDSPENFKDVGIVLWNLSRTNDVITLYSPFTGARASVKVEYVKGNTVKFIKEGNYEDKRLVDTVEITLDGDTFSGKNYLTLSNSLGLDGSSNTEKHATYVLVGRKISGSGVLE